MGGSSGSSVQGRDIPLRTPTPFGEWVIGEWVMSWSHISVSGGDAQSLESLACGFEVCLSPFIVSGLVTGEQEEGKGFLGAGIFYLIIEGEQFGEGTFEAGKGLVKFVLSLPDTPLQAVALGGKLAIVAAVCKLHRLIEVVLSLL